MEIDLVYLWVNGNDPQWQAKRQSVTGDIGHTSVNCRGRYMDNGELKYSLRSIGLYAPWVRKIFIVTDNQVPEWLDTAHPKIQIVDHSEILPEESRPCFNSVIIENFLYKIPGLSEYFLYGNDDMLINRPVTPETFFAADGFPIVRMNRRLFRKSYVWFRQKILKKKLSGYNRQIANAANLVNSKLGIYFGDMTHHNIDSYRKSDYEHVYNMFKNVIKPTLVHHIRDNEDINRHIYSYVPLAEKRAHAQYVNKKTSFRLQIHEVEQYQKLEEYNPIFFCMNDSQFATDEDRRRSSEYLEKRFPNKSEFEK